MSKTSLIQRELKRNITVKKYADKRKKIIEAIQNPKLSLDDRFEARLQLQKLPRNANPVRLRNRCALTGRPRGVFSKFGIARNKLRELMMRGEVPGIIKASW